jgi:hypothetical protein
VVRIHPVHGSGPTYLLASLPGCPPPIQTKLREAAAAEQKAKERAAAFRADAEKSLAEATSLRAQLEEASAASKLVGALNNELQATQVRRD